MVEFTLTDESCERTGVGLIYTATLNERTEHLQLSELIGKNIETPDGVLHKIIGVESFAIVSLAAGTPIGLILDPLEKPFA